MRCWSRSGQRYSRDIPDPSRRHHLLQLITDSQVLEEGMEKHNTQIEELTLRLQSTQMLGARCRTEKQLREDEEFRVVFGIPETEYIICGSLNPLRNHPRRIFNVVSWVSEHQCSYNDAAGKLYLSPDWVCFAPTLARRESVSSPTVKINFQQIKDIEKVGPASHRPPSLALLRFVRTLCFCPISDPEESAGGRLRQASQNLHQGLGPLSNEFSTERQTCANITSLSRASIRVSAFSLDPLPSSTHLTSHISSLTCIPPIIFWKPKNP